jgi:hypothetical protein
VVHGVYIRGGQYCLAFFVVTLLRGSNLKVTVVT